MYSYSVIDRDLQGCIGGTKLNNNISEVSIDRLDSVARSNLDLHILKHSSL